MLPTQERENVLNNLTLLITSNMAYIRYLESNGKNSELNQEYCDFSSIKIAYAAFALILWKDEYIKKDITNNLSTILSDKLLDKYVSLIAKRNKDGSWNLGEIKLNSNYEVIDKIRNKLAHGDYVIKTEVIEINIDGKKAEISINDLVSFTSHIANDWEKLKAYGENNYSIIRDNYLGNNTLKHISTENDYEEALENFYYVEINDMPLLGKQRDEEYIKLMYNYKAIVMEAINRHISVEEIKKLYNKAMEKRGIKITLKESKVSSLKSSKQVKKLYISNKEYFHKLSSEEQHRQLGFWLHEAIKKDMPKKNISFGLAGNQMLLKNLEKNPLLPLKDLIENSSEQAPVLSILTEKIKMVAYIVNFYVIYAYGLEQIYTSDSREHISDIYSNKMFDFSKLDLSKINPTILEIEKDFIEFPEQVQKIAKEAIEISDKYDKYSENLKKFKEVIGSNPTETQKDKYSNLVQIIKELGHKYGEKSEIAEYSSQFLKTDFEQYKRNRAIIEHIRNSIAHGNVELNVFSDDGTIGSSTITFKDIYQNKNTFELTISLREFLSLFNQYNLTQIYDYINKNVMTYNSENMKK